MLIHSLSAVLSAFLASLVEVVEAFTIVLAVGVTHGWRPALTGTAAGLVVLAALVAVVGPLVGAVPLSALQGVVGLLLLLFGMRWLRKAVLRAAGRIPLHDEEAAFAHERRLLTGRPALAAGTAAFQAVVLEGVEVVFIVVAVGAGRGLLGAASLGAAAAAALVLAAGMVLHKPLSLVPENTLKFIVGVMLSAFGTFWLGEAVGAAWPGTDFALLPMALGFLLAAIVGVRVAELRE
ncbi:MAG: hypothetical protein KGK10_07270 [Rhodospirillales bacterium]|nr:hypothetical protein [Rhodospirillales bacterium]